MKIGRQTDRETDIDINPPSQLKHVFAESKISKVIFFDQK